MSCYKFIKDQAQIPEEEAGNAISGGTNNRVGMTALVLDKKYGQHISDVVGEHEELTMAEGRRRRARNFCANCCKFWTYRKVVSQEEIYKMNMQKIMRYKEQ